MHICLEKVTSGFLSWDPASSSQMRALPKRCGGKGILVSSMLRQGQVKALWGPCWGSSLSPSRCVPQVEEALAVLQAHQATEQTLDVPESRWVGVGDGGREEW